MNDKGIKSGFHFGYAVFLGIVIINILQGAWANTISVFYVPLMESFGVPLTMVSAWSTIQALLAAFLMPFTAKFFQKYDTKLTVTASITAIGIAMLVNTFAPNVYIYWTAGFFGAFACDIISFLLAPVILGNWFKKGISTLFAITISAQALSGTFFAPVLSWIIKNYNYHYAYGLIALMCFVIGIPTAIFLIVKTPSQKGLKAIDFGKEKKKDADSGVLLGMDVKTAKKKIGFYLLCASAGSWSFVGLFQNFLNAYAQSIGHDIMSAGYISSANMFGFMLGYILAGLICDTLSVRAGVLIDCASAAAAFAALLLTGGQLTIMIAAGFVIGFGYAGKQIVMSAAVREVFGARDFANVWAGISSINLFIAAFAYTLWAQLAVMIGYRACMFICLVVYVFVTIAANITLNLAKSYRKEWVE